MDLPLYSTQRREGRGIWEGMVAGGAKLYKSSPYEGLD
jgi:hypothetical protein